MNAKRLIIAAGSALTLTAALLPATASADRGDKVTTSGDDLAGYAGHPARSPTRSSRAGWS